MDETAHLAELGQFVRDEIAAFVVPERHPEQLGSTLPPEWFGEQLEEMRAALVDPRFVELDADGASPERGPFRVAIVAEDEWIFLAYDPNPTGDFALIFKTASGFGLSPIRGGAVDCFMAR